MLFWAALGVEVGPVGEGGGRNFSVPACLHGPRQTVAALSFLCFPGRAIEPYVVFVLRMFCALVEIMGDGVLDFSLVAYSAACDE